MKSCIAIAAVALFLALSAQAHTLLRGSTPAASSVVAVSPEKVVLTFSGNARLTALTLQKGQETPLTLGPLPAQAAKDLSVPLPALTPGEYTVNWRIMGADAHAMSGKFAFKVGGAGTTQGKTP